MAVLELYIRCEKKKMFSHNQHYPDFKISVPQISLACLKENPQLSVFRSLRTLRALRPLRAISRMEGMKVS